MKKRIQALCAIVAVCTALFTTSLHAAGFTDTFNSIDPAWTQDRMNPSGFSSTSFDGDNRLKLDIAAADYQGAGSFYNTQGKGREALINGDWAVTGQLYLSQDMFTASLLDITSQWATSLWTRTGTVGTEDFADYPIIRIENLGSGANVKVWDSDIGYTSFGGSLLQVGWNDLSIFGGLGGYSFGINGTNIYNDATSIMPDSLTGIIVQGHNLGADRTYYWDNISAQSGSASVPDGGPGLAGIAATLSLLGLAAAKFKGVAALTSIA